MSRHRKAPARAQTRDERRAHIEVAMLIADDFSDGAFWGYMQEMEIDVEEIPSWDETLGRYVYPDEVGGKLERDQ